MWPSGPVVIDLMVTCWPVSVLSKSLPVPVLRL
jgi:hypothetical protein